MMIDTSLLIAMGAAYKKVQAGDIIFRENAQANFYHQLESGSVKWVNIDDEGHEFIQTLVLPGECFGEMPLFDNGPYAASAIAEKDSVILRLHHASFHQMLKDNPEIYASFTKLLSLRLRYKFLVTKEVAAHNPEHTITTLLNHFKKEKNHLCPDCHQLKLTRQQLAGMTGMRVETVIRTMRVMHDKGALRIEKGRVFC
jgi:CRP-like cAMP-binding protein